MAVVTLYPSAGIGVQAWDYTTGIQAPAGSQRILYAVLGSSGDGWAMTATEVGTQPLGDVPADFAYATQVTISLKSRTINVVNDTNSLSVQVVGADGTTPLTGSMFLFQNVATWADTPASGSILPSLVAGDKDTWNGAQLKVTHTVAANMGADAGIAVLVDSMSITVTYAQLAPVDQAEYQFFADGPEASSVALGPAGTPTAVSIGMGDATVQLRTRLQTAAVAVAGTSFALEWEKNSSGTWNRVNPEGQTLAVYYPNVNARTGSTGDYLASGSSFKGNGRKLTKAGLRLQMYGPQSGYTVRAELYAHTGTYGTSSGLPTGSPLAVSTSRPLTDIPTDTQGVQFTDFDFDGSYTLVNGTAYYIVWARSAIVAGSAPMWWFETTGTWEGGGATKNASGVWAYQGDISFRVYTDSATSPANDVLPFDSVNFTSLSGTTSRLGAGTGSFVAGVVSEDGLVSYVGQAANSYTEHLYSILLKKASLVAGNTLKFRVTAITGASIVTYSKTPTINVVSTVDVTQPAYRFYADGTESASTALAVQDTPIAVNILDGDARLQLRTRAQSTSVATIPATSDFQLQYQTTRGGNVISRGSDHLALSYDETYRDSYMQAYLGGGATMLAQDAIVGDGGYLSRISFLLSRATTLPTGTITAELRDVSGQVVLATSSPVSTSALPASGTFVWVDFTFDSTFKLQTGTMYTIVVSAPTGSSAATNALWAGVDNSSPAAPGVGWSFFAGAWGSGTWDLCYKVYTITDTWANVGTTYTPRLTTGKTGSNSNYNMGATLFRGQSFIGDGSTLGKVRFLVDPSGTTPFGRAALYAHTGTFDTSTGTGTGQPLAVTPWRPVNELSYYTTGWTDFDFSGTYTLTSGTPYVIGVQLSAVSSSVLMYSKSGSTVPGCVVAQDATGAWVASIPTYELMYELNSVSPPATLVSYIDTWNSSQSVQPISQSAQVGESFIGNGEYLTSASMLFALSSGTGSGGPITLSLYSHTGTYGTSSSKPLTLLATAETMNSSALTTTTKSWQSFRFPTPYLLTAGTPYFLVLNFTGTTSEFYSIQGTSTATALLPYEGTSVGGNGTTWTWTSTMDYNFQVVTTAPQSIVPYDSPSLTEGQATTNRLGAGTGSFSPGKVSEDGVVNDLGFPGNNHTELLYSLQVNAAAGVDGDTIQFRTLFNGESVLADNGPKIDITTASGPRGQGTVTHLWTITPPTGVKPVVPPKLGSATTSHVWTVAPAAGWQPKKGQSTASHLWTIAPATGKRITRTPQVTADHLWTSAPVTGKRYPKAQSTATHLWTITATTKRYPKAQSTASHLWTNTAVGVQPVVVRSGAGLVYWFEGVTPATGKRVAKGSVSTVDHVWTTAATGKKVMKTTSVVTAHTWATAAAGVKPVVPTLTGSATVNWLISDTAQGKRYPKAQATNAAHLWVAAASGVTTLMTPEGDALWKWSANIADTEVEADTAPILIGTRFTVDEDVLVSSIRYYRPPFYGPGVTLELRIHEEL